jgi:hypothetical protein
MAKLSANGYELARLHASYRDPEHDEFMEIEYSVRSNGRIMKKFRLRGPRYSRQTWGGWRHAWRWTGEPERLGVVVGRLRERLTRDGFAVEDVTA